MTRESPPPFPFLFPAVVLALAALFAGAPAATAQPPNFLLVLVDDLGIEHLDFYGVGAQFAPTPHLTELASGGLVFREAWSNPTCSPTRVTIQTGRYAFRTGVGDVINTDTEAGMQLAELILPEVLRDHTATPYTSAAFGKWHMGASADLGGASAPNWAGYDHFEGTLLGQQDPSTFSYFDWVKTTDGVNEAKTDYMTTDMVDSAVTWINGTPGPWFAYVAFRLPHGPYHWPPDDLHSQDTGQEGDLAKYRAMIEAMDNELHRLLDSIDTTNTLIVFASDNGSPAEVAQPPVNPQRSKGTVFQGGVRVPLVLAGDMVTAGEVGAPVNLTDLFDTIAELAGASVPVDVERDSVSLVPYLSNPGTPSLRANAYTDAFSPNGSGPYSVGQQAARDTHYKYLRNTAGAEGLIDLWSDPWETNNLLLGDLTSEQQSALDALGDYLDELMGVCSLGQQGDPCNTDEDCCSGRCQRRRWQKVCRDLAF